MKVHELKVWPDQFPSLATGAKPFEFRKNDRDFAVGDRLRLREWCPQSGAYTSSTPIERHVTYVLAGGFGLPEGFCVLGMGAPANDNARTAAPKLNAKSIELLRDAAEAMISIGDTRAGNALSMLLDWHDRPAPANDNALLEVGREIIALADAEGVPPGVSLDDMKSEWGARWRRAFVRLRSIVSSADRK